MRNQSPHGKCDRNHTSLYLFVEVGQEPESLVFEVPAGLTAKNLQQTERVFGDAGPIEAQSYLTRVSKKGIKNKPTPLC